MLRGVKNGIGFMISITLGIFAIVVASWGLISFWTSMPRPTQYEIMDVQRSTGDHECDTPFVTILKDITTKSTEYRCGKLGRVHEITELIPEENE